MGQDELDFPAKGQRAANLLDMEEGGTLALRAPERVVWLREESEEGVV